MKMDIVFCGMHTKLVNYYRFSFRNRASVSST
jgi:hypothetical protein